MASWREDHSLAGTDDVLTSSSDTPPASASSRDKDKKQKQQQPRQLLSCSKCRERKVKCDRTKPCSACCARGHPKECHFVLAEGTTYGPVQQAMELRKLRAENQRLKERLLRGKVSESGDEDEDESQTGGHASQRIRVPQRRFGSDDTTDNLYFGSPGLASIITDFAELQFEPKSLSHTMPRGVDMYAPEGVMYPFPSIWTASTYLSGLYSCLQPWDTVSRYLDSYLALSSSRAWPHYAQEVTRKEVERFLADFEQNATAFPDMLALILAALATGLQQGVYERSGGQWVDGAVDAERTKGDMFIAATMQALRMSSFMSQPTLLSIQALVMLGPYLTNSGRFLDAWSLFGTTIRSAQSIGLHRNPRHLDPPPSLREVQLRKKLWWWMLHMDQQYSVTLGRPLGISGIGDCPLPEPLTTNPAMLRAGEFIDHLSILGRQILSSDQLKNLRIDNFTDKLHALWDTLPESLQFDQTWVHDKSKIPESPMDELAVVLYCKIQNFLVLLNRQRMQNNQPNSSWPSPPQSSAKSLVSDSAYTPMTVSGAGNTRLCRGRAQVLSSCLALLDAFEFYYHHLPANLVDWTIGQQAFNATMILLLDMHEARDTRHRERVDLAFAIFHELDDKGVHKLAKLAVSRISRETVRLRDALAMRRPAPPSTSSSLSSMPESAMVKSQTWPQPLHEEPNTMMDTYGPNSEAVMDNTGMFLLEDAGLQSPAQSSFSARRDSQFALEEMQIAAGKRRESSTTQVGFISNVSNHRAVVQQQQQQQQQRQQYQQANSPFAIGLQPRLHSQQPAAGFVVGSITDEGSRTPAERSVRRTNIVPQQRQQQGQQLEQHFGQQYQQYDVQMQGYRQQNQHAYQQPQPQPQQQQVRPQQVRRSSEQCIARPQQEHTQSQHQVRRG